MLPVAGGAGSTNWGYQNPLWGWDWVMRSYMDGANDVFQCPSDATAIRRGVWNDVPGQPGYTPWPAGEDPDRTIDDIPASYRINLSNQTEDILAYKVTELDNATKSIVFSDGQPDRFHQLESWDPTPVANGGLAAIGAGKDQIANVPAKRHTADDKMFRGDPLSPTATPIFKINAAFADGHGESIEWDRTFEVTGDVKTYTTRTGTTAVGVPTMWRQIFRSNDLIDTYDNPNTDADDGNAFPG